MNAIKLINKLFISTYAVELCKHLHQLDMQHCCGCQVKNSHVECLMLTEDEKIELYFDEALQIVDLARVIDRVADNMKPFEITIETEAELHSWREKNPALSPDMNQKIKDTVKVIRMY